MKYGKKKQPKPENHVTFNCGNCGKEVTRYKKYGNGHLKYCSNECARKHTKTRKFYAVEDFDIVFESSWEVFFWGLCAMEKLSVDRFDREHGVEWKPGCWYAPDFWLPTLEIAVEIKGQPDAADLARWNAFAQQRSLAVLGQAELDQLRKAEDFPGTLRVIAAATAATSLMAEGD